jgi:hypothetical protein
MSITTSCFCRINFRGVAGGQNPNDLKMTCTEAVSYLKRLNADYQGTDIAPLKDVTYELTNGYGCYHASESAQTAAEAAAKIQQFMNDPKF